MRVGAGLPGWGERAVESAAALHAVPAVVFTGFPDFFLGGEAGEGRNLLSTLPDQVGKAHVVEHTRMHRDEAILGDHRRDHIHEAGGELLAARPVDHLITAPTTCTRVLVAVVEHVSDTVHEFFVVDHEPLVVEVLGGDGELGFETEVITTAAGDFGDECVDTEFADMNRIHLVE